MPVRLFLYLQYRTSACWAVAIERVSLLVTVFSLALRRFGRASFLSVFEFAMCSGYVARPMEIVFCT